ncbi:MAG: winged helix-turn-helix domain-containing protein [Promethearchaeota archaeon]
MRKIQVIKNVVSLPRFRTLVGRELKITTQENVYGEKTSEEKFNNVLNDALFDEFSGQEILYLLQQGPKSVDQLATLLNLDSSKVLQYIVKLRSDGDIDLNNIDGLVPMYKAVFRGNL